MPSKVTWRTLPRSRAVVRHGASDDTLPGWNSYHTPGNYAPIHVLVSCRLQSRCATTLRNCEYKAHRSNGRDRFLSQVSFSVSAMARPAAAPLLFFLFFSFVVFVRISPLGIYQFEWNIYGQRLELTLYTRDTLHNRNGVLLFFQAHQ